MSDLVRFLSGTTPVRDHAYWPIVTMDEVRALFTSQGMSDPEIDYTVATIWPLEVPLDDYMKLCWRIKQWTFSGSFSSTVLDGTNTFVARTMDATITGVDVKMYQIPPGSDDDDSVPITTEHMILGPTRDRGVGNGWDDRKFHHGNRNNGHYLLNDEDDGVDNPTLTYLVDYNNTGILHSPPGDPNSSTEWLVQVLRPEVPVVFDDGTNLFKVPINFLMSGQGKSRENGSPNIFRVTNVSVAGPGDDVFGSLTIDLVGNTYNIDLTMTAPPPDFGDISGSCSASLTANHFWEYQNSNGQPVYDEGNGDVLNDWQ